MIFHYDEKKLISNPNVSKFDGFTLKLSIDFRVKLYKEWRHNHDPGAIDRMLEENGLGKELTGSNYYVTLINGFKISGYPVYKNSEIALITDYREENPILTSGKFVRLNFGNRTRISSDFEQELFSYYPEVSVEEGISNAGLDPIDVGSQRIQKLKKVFETRAKKLYETNTYPQRKSPDGDEDADSEELINLIEHPYVKKVDGASIVIREAFYNETYLIAALPLDEILKIYDFETTCFSQQNKIRINSKLYHWKPTDDEMKDHSEQILMIQAKRANAMSRMIADNFRDIGNRLSELDIDKRRMFCRWINELPRDPWGFYTQKRILEKTGMSKSTYYELLNNEDYGCSAKRKANQEEEDIELIRQVLYYKGFEKGIRQVYMMMPEITGKQFSIHRIRRLMQKYGIRTTIRRPSKNRKAMKELIERNRKSNLLMRRFKLHRPNEVRLTDVTYLDYGDDKRAYGSASVDPVTGRLICFIISESNDLQLALDTLKAMDEYPAINGAILHSDQGILYMTDDFQKAVVARELTQSMSRRGNCWDNAPQESFFGHFKDESRYKNCKSTEELKEKVMDYSVYYNKERRMWDRGRMTPIEFEAYLSAMEDEEFAGYLAKEEERYLKMREKSAQKAVQNAKEYKNTIQDKLEELGYEACE
ncbi:MAG TPA: IS3 family transposase [Lachnospiraceae bacterium]|nr:IS3 family transposase [Lachnospiraceae bacterium]